MPMQPGPFTMAPSTDVAFNIVNYNFVGEANTDLAGLDAVETGIDLEMAGLVIFAGGNDDPIGDVIDLAITNLAGLDPDVTVSSLAGMAAASDNFDTALTAGIASAPAAAWAPTTAVFVPPSPVNIEPPLLSPGVYGGYTDPNPGLGGSSATTGSSIAINNLTRVGSQNFCVGDTVQIVARGRAGADVGYEAIFNGVFFGNTDVGPIPASGVLTFDGTADAWQVGAWTENWWIGGELVATVNFTVLSAS
jgi:hypothetical protein